LPGKKSTSRSVPQVAAVLDVSGSMCSPEVLNQLRPAVAFLEKRRLLAKSYTCDVQLRPLTSVVTGGGGTELNNSHVEQIKKDLGKGKIALLYITDGYVDLSQISHNDDVELHVINVHGLKDYLKSS
jgi:predicted metal-dependent peptidase